ncbi:hypothetical protein [Pseudomonas gingeri]
MPTIVIVSAGYVSVFCLALPGRRLHAVGHHRRAHSRGYSKLVQKTNADQVVFKIIKTSFLPGLNNADKTI